MKPNRKLSPVATIVALACSVTTLIATTNATESASSALGSSADKPLPEDVTKSPDEAREQKWNWHAQNTDIVQGDPGFPAKYSGPNRSEEHTSELQSLRHLVCRLLLA